MSIERFNILDKFINGTIKRGGIETLKNSNSPALWIMVYLLWELYNQNKEILHFLKALILQHKTPILP